MLSCMGTDANYEQDPCVTFVFVCIHPDDINIIFPDSIRRHASCPGGKMIPKSH